MPSDGEELHTSDSTECCLSVSVFTSAFTNLSPATDSPFSSISPTSHSATHLPTLHLSTSPSNISTETIAVFALKGQTDRRSMGTHSHPLQKRADYSPPSCPPMLQATEEAPPAELKASPKALNRRHTTHLSSTARRATKQPFSVCSTYT